MAKNKKGTKLPKFNLKSTVAVLLAILLIAGGFYVKNYLDQRQLEDNFAVLEQDMTSLKDDIETNIPGAELDEEKYCYRESFKYKEGSLKCRVEISSAKLLGKKDMQKVQSTLKNNDNWVQTKGADTSNLPSSSSDVYYKNNFLCSADYTIHMNSSEQGKFTFHCSSFSDRSFYPYREN